MTIEQGLIGLSHRVVPLGGHVRMTARAMLAGHLHSLIVDEQTAKAFDLCSLCFGQEELMLNAGPIPLSMFATEMPRWPSAFEIVPEQELADVPRLWRAAPFQVGHDIRVEVCNAYSAGALPFRGALVVTVRDESSVKKRTRGHYFRGELEAATPAELRYRAVESGTVARVVFAADCAEDFMVQGMRIEHEDEAIVARPLSLEAPSFVANDDVVIRIFNKSGRLRPYVAALMLEVGGQADGS